MKTVTLINSFHNTECNISEKWGYDPISAWDNLSIVGNSYEMKKYRIESSEGVILGIYEAETEEEAIRAMNADAGEEDLDRNDGLIVRVETN